jgi:hypothetical protein
LGSNIEYENLKKIKLKYENDDDNKYQYELSKLVDKLEKEFDKKLLFENFY